MLSLQQQATSQTFNMATPPLSSVQVYNTNLCSSTFSGLTWAYGFWWYLTRNSMDHLQLTVRSWESIKTLPRSCCELILPARVPFFLEIGHRLVTGWSVPDRTTHTGHIWILCLWTKLISKAPIPRRQLPDNCPTQPGMQLAWLVVSSIENMYQSTSIRAEER